MAAFLSAAAAAIGSTSVGSALVRILIAYGISRLINKANDNGNGSTFNETGVRVQAAPDTTNPIPLVYGSAYLGGKITDAYLTNENKTMWYALTLTEVPHETTALSGNTITTSFGDIFMNGQQVYFKDDGITVDYTVNADGIVDTSARDLIKIYLYKRGAGNPTLPQYFLDKPTPPALPGYAFNVMPNWDNTFLMRELAFALVRVDYNRDKGISGLPDLKFNVANTLYRPGDAIYSYLINEISGGAIPADNIDTASLLALNDYADDTVSYLDETDNTVKTLGNRYQINGVLDPKNSVLQNLQRLAANTGCFINYDITTGKWGVVINRDTATTLHFDDSNIISGIDLTGTSLDNMYNSVEVQFPHRELRDQMDTIRIDLPTEYLNANEPPNVLRLQMDLLNEPLQARELGYLELYQNRMDRVVTFTTDYSKINTEAGDVITITSDVYGWTNQPFRVMRVREVESDEGGLAVEITAQEYDATIYTAGGQPRRPRVPTEPIGIPSIGVIGTPLAPTITTQNSVAVPAVVLTASVPSGLVDRMEYWYSSDNGTTWLLGDTDKNANGAPFNQGDTSQVRLPTLVAGTYLFKVRAGNESAFGEFSPATTGFTWEPIQVTDQVTADTTVDSGLGSLLPMLGMGALAYLAYKTLYPELLKELSQTDLGKLLGIQDPAEIAAAQAALEKQAAAYRIVTAGNVSMSAGVDDTLTFIAGNNIEITVDDIGHEITISAIGAAGGGVTKVIAGNGIKVTPEEGTGDVTVSLVESTTPGGLVDADAIGVGSYNLIGSDFPCKYITGSGSKTAIFTHGYLVFGTSTYGDTIKPSNVVTPGARFVPKLLNGAAILDKSLYYSECQYDASKPLREQTWASWKKYIPESTVTETYIDGKTNPKVADYYLPYKVDGEYQYNAQDLKTTITQLDYQKRYDYFLPNNDKVLTRTKTVVNSSIVMEAGKLFVFGASEFINDDVVPFDINTIWGEATLDYVTVEVVVDGFPGGYYTGSYAVSSIPANALVGNGNRYVSNRYVGGSDAYANINDFDQLWWSDDYTNWYKVKNVTFEGNAINDIESYTGRFYLLPYNQNLGKFIAIRNYYLNDATHYEIASSSDGTNWVEHAKTYPGTVTSIPKFYTNANGSDVQYYDAQNLKYSTNGFDWYSAPTEYSTFDAPQWNIGKQKWYLKVHSSISELTNLYNVTSLANATPTSSFTNITFASGVTKFTDYAYNAVYNLSYPDMIANGWTLTRLEIGVEQWVVVNDRIYIVGVGTKYWYDPNNPLGTSGPIKGSKTIKDIFGIYTLDSAGNIIISSAFDITGQAGTRNCTLGLANETNLSVFGNDGIKDCEIRYADGAWTYDQMQYLPNLQIGSKVFRITPNTAPTLNYLTYRNTNSFGTELLAINSKMHYDDIALALKTNYYYPGVSGTPSIYRVAPYAIKLDTNEITYNISWTI